jgi:hypothetical protein
MLTPEVVASTTCPPERAAVEIYDGEVPGLTLRISRGGNKTFSLVYRVDGKRKDLGRVASMSIDQARQAARQILSGHPPDSFAELARAFLVNKAGHLRPRTLKEYRRLIETVLIPAWGLYVVRSIGTNRARQQESMSPSGLSSGHGLVM